MVDPNKIKDFLARTAAALQKSMDSGDAEGASRYEQMIDRAVPLAERAVSQAQYQEPVIPWRKQDVTIPPIGGKTEQAAPTPVFDNPFKSKQPQSPLLTMPGGQATPQTSKGPTQLPKANTVPAQPVENAGIAAGMGFGVPGGEAVPGKIVGLLDLPSMPFKNDKKAAPLDLPSSQPSAIEGEVETQEPYVKQNAGLPEPELMDIVGQAEANPYDDVEAEAIKRIKAEAVDKPNPLMYIFTLLMMGAPRTFAMIMADQNRYSQNIRDIYNSVRRDKTDWERNKTAHSFRSREVQANEDRALAALARADNDKLRAQQGEQGKDLRTIMQAPLDPKDPLSARARELMMTRLPK